MSIVLFCLLAPLMPYCSGSIRHRINGESRTTETGPEHGFPTVEYAAGCECFGRLDMFIPPTDLHPISTPELCDRQDAARVSGPVCRATRNQIGMRLSQPQIPNLDS